MNQRSESLRVHHSAGEEALRVLHVPVEAPNDFGQQLGVGIVVIETHPAYGLDGYVAVLASRKRGNEIFGSCEVYVQLEAFLDALDVAEDLFIVRIEISVYRGFPPAGVHRRASVAARDPWFVLAPPRGAFLIPRRIGERMPVARSDGTAFDNNLFGITPRAGIDPVALHAVMNATITRLCLELEARELTGAQAVVDTNVYLVKAIPVPRPDLLLARKDELARLLNPLVSRSARSIFDVNKAQQRHLASAYVVSVNRVNLGNHLNFQNL